MIIFFENSIGKISMGEPYNWRITNIEGLGLAGKKRNTAVYANTVGQELLSEVVNARTITIKGDIKCLDAQREISRAMRILNSDGELQLRYGFRSKKIKCSCTEFDITERNGEYQTFIMQLICDYPYFSDISNTTLAIFKRTKNIKTPFVLPMVFTSRLCETDIRNSGDVITEPKIIINVTKASEDAGEIVIENITTNQTIKLDYQPAEGEEIIIDIENREITSNINGNIINSLDDDSYLSDFYLSVGNNHLKVTNGTGGEVTAVCEFTNRYIEGEY